MSNSADRFIGCLEWAATKAVLKLVVENFCRESRATSRAEADAAASGDASDAITCLGSHEFIKGGMGGHVTPTRQGIDYAKRTGLVAPDLDC